MQLDEKSLAKLDKDLSGGWVFSLVKSKLESNALDRESIKQLLEHNHNVLDLSTAKYLLDNKVLSRGDFMDCGIDEQFLDMLYEEGPVDPADASSFKPIRTIKEGVTEVYFWGTPASGKSCALGAVMSMAKNGYGSMRNHLCQGADYMNRLSQIFRNHGCYTFLPHGTSMMSTYEMRFSLTRNKKEHPLALIDLSGELFTCLYKKYSSIELSEDEEAAFKVLKNILVEHPSGSRKIHFFVIEYGSENKKYNGLSQDVYLQRAAEYLESMSVFTEYTDAIYIVLTKADRAPSFDTFEEEQTHFQNYMSTNYHGFYWALSAMCKKHSINGGILQFVPFSIGEVCLRKLCRFDSTSANEILDYIVERSFYIERSCFGNVKRYLRK